MRIWRTRPDTLGGMNPCGLTRLLVPAFLVGLAVATVLGNDLYGWIAAGAAIVALAVARRALGTDQTCAIPALPVSDRVEVARDAASSGPLR